MAYNLRDNGVSVNAERGLRPISAGESPIRHSITSPATLSESPSHSPPIITGQHSPLLPRHRTDTASSQDKSRSDRSPFKTLHTQTSILSDSSNTSASTTTPHIIGSVGDEDGPLTAPADLSVSRGSPNFHRSRSEGKLFMSADSKKDGPPSSSKLSKRESLKVEKRKYRKEKKRAAKELLSTLKDPTVIVMADWLKVRGTLKSWTKLWCVLKPGLLVLYRSHKQKANHWVGTILLNTCELIERPSKKDGFCFKLYHPLEQSIWATKGPKGESIGAITQPLPYSYLIFRAPSEPAGKCWMDALELALRCSSLLLRTMNKPDTLDSSITSKEEVDGHGFLLPNRVNQWEDMNDSDCEKHFDAMDEDEMRTDKDETIDDKSDTSGTSGDEEEEKEVFDEDLQPLETPYNENPPEELGLAGDASQTEEVADENKSLIWTLVKQVRPGMDLSKVVLPTFILEPRSFLDKLSDYYYHCNILAETVKEEDPYSRLKGVVRWYLSGFYKKPKGLKKPYNPILGEVFRCYWKNPNTHTRTFYIAEQISHHPPVSAFYVSNRQDGYAVNCSMLCKSKFYGNSLSAILDGVARLSFLKRGEDYLVTMPYAHCKGILIGTLTMEMGGKVSIECEKTGYRAELEFKLKPFLGSGEASNRVTGKIKLMEETLATIDGKWDQEIMIREKSTGQNESFWNPNEDMKRTRLKRFTVKPECQSDHESERMWMHVAEAITNCDNNAATHEKFLLEDMQRNEARERKAKMEDWQPRLFEQDELTGDWVYKYADLRPWDPMNDVLQYENNYVIQTKTRHRMPVVRTTSITNVDESVRLGKRPSGMGLASQARIKRASMKHKQLKPLKSGIVDSGSSSPDQIDSDSDSADCSRRTVKTMARVLSTALEPLVSLQREANQKLSTVQGQLATVQRQIRSTSAEQDQLFTNRDVFLVGALLIIQLALMWLFK